uniref:Glycosyltransferase family 2 protein n=1 Tax=Fundidesulfovibrio putealis TaxID=270496 RepID=A0A7C4AG59_9BACT
MTGPRVCVVVVNYCTPKLTQACLASVARVTDPDATDIIVVDNASSPSCLEELERAAPGVQVIASSRNRGFGGGCNLGASFARGEYLFFLNSDATLTEDTPGILSRFLDAHPEAACAGSALADPDGTPQHAAARFPTALRVFAGRDLFAARLKRLSPWLSERLAFFHDPEQFDAPAKVDWVVGAALMVRRKDFQNLGGFDESIFLYGEEMELQKRLALRGRLVYFIPGTSVLHGEAASSGGEDSPQRLARIVAGHRRYYVLHNGLISAFALCCAEVAGSLAKCVVWGLLNLLRPSPDNKRRLRWHTHYLRALVTPRSH